MLIGSLSSPREGKFLGVTFTILVDKIALACRYRHAEHHRVFRRFLGNMMPAGCCVS